MEVCVFIVNFNLWISGGCLARLESIKMIYVNCMGFIIHSLLLPSGKIENSVVAISIVSVRKDYATRFLFHNFENKYLCRFENRNLKLLLFRMYLVHLFPTGFCPTLRGFIWIPRNFRESNIILQTKYFQF